MSFRVATYSTINYNNLQTMRLRVNYASTNQQIVSGLRSETYGGIAKDAQAIVQLDTEVSRTQTFIDRITSVEGELDTMYDSLSLVISELNIFMGNLSAAISGNLLSDNELQSAASSVYDSVISSLNVSFQGKFLFGGANTANLPVDVNDPTYPTPFVAGSLPNTNYYQGDNTVLSVQVDENYTIDYGIRADNATFEALLRGIDMVMNNPGNIAERNTALDIFETVSRGLTTIQHEISTDSEKMLNVKDAHEASRAQLQNLVSILRDVDVAEASTRLASIETQLEASFSATGRLLNLSILDYLRK